MIGRSTLLYEMLGSDFKYMQTGLYFNFLTRTIKSGNGMKTDRQTDRQTTDLNIS
jgi:hypothetical protein